MEVGVKPTQLDSPSTFDATEYSVTALREHALLLQSHCAFLAEVAIVVPGSASELDDVGLAFERLSHQVGRLQVNFAARMEQAIQDLNSDVQLSSERSKFRSAKERLSQVLHVNPGEVQKRLDIAHAITPVESPEGDVETAHPLIGRAFEDAALPVSLAAKMIGAVDRLRAPIEQVTGSAEEADLLSDCMEADLLKAATSSTPKAVDRRVKDWENRINSMGVLPTQQVKQEIQGAFYLGRFMGLHRWSLLADDLQHETLLTVMAPEVSPRSRNHVSEDAGSGLGTQLSSGAGLDSGLDSGPGSRAGAEGGEVSEAVALDENGRPLEAPKDGRSLAQKRLDGVLHALSAGLKGGNVSLHGGYHPQVIVNIDQKSLERDLLASYVEFRSDAVHSGPINPRIIRQLACNAELLPVVLGGDSQVVDAGNRRRLFSAEQRKLLYARDRGCTFPGCTTGVDRCEAHHVLEYSKGGVTTLENAAMVCSHHHHLVHETAWAIVMRNGVPFWKPPVHEDAQRPLMRNAYFHPEKAQQLALSV